jgi:acyl-CoA dehydrogenase
MAKLATRATGGYARVRSQFKTAIGKFEGIEEPLARMGGHTYLMDAARMMTATAIDLGEKPSVASAIVKYHITERARIVVNDAMDILGGKGICLGPNNFMGRAYQQVPVSITVEGANILTRSLIIFGQGAIRCHPYVLSEMRAAQNPDAPQARVNFDRAISGHVAFAITNGVRTLGHGLTRGLFAAAPAKVAPEAKGYYKDLARYSAAFAFLSDVSMGVLGGELKRREKLSARLGDILSLMYLASATLRRYEVEGRQTADAPLMHWAMQDALFKIQAAFDGVLANFPSRVLAKMLNAMIFPLDRLLGREHGVPTDELGHQVAQLLIGPSATRDRLTAGMYAPLDENDAVGVVELALAATVACEPIDAKIKAAQKLRQVGAGNTAIREAMDAGVITAAEYALLERRAYLRDKAVRVDDFPQDFHHESVVSRNLASVPMPHKLAA